MALSNQKKHLRVINKRRNSQGLNNNEGAIPHLIWTLPKSGISGLGVHISESIYLKMSVFLSRCRLSAASLVFTAAGAQLSAQQKSAS